MTSTNDVSKFALAWLEKVISEKEKNTQNAQNIPYHIQQNLVLTTWALGLFQLLLILLFATLGGTELMTATTDYGTPTQGYNMFIGVLIMMLLGFAPLMCFIKWYGVGSMGFVLLLTSMALQWALFTESFWQQLCFDDHWHNVYVNIYSLLNCLYAVSAVLISFGAVIGKITPFQLIVMTFVELGLHSLNYKVFMSYAMEIADVGGTYSDHMFGAYFGLAVAWVLGPPKHEPEFSNTSDILSLLGTVFLWIYWPSFVVGAAGADTSQQERGFVNTILSLSASTVITFWCTLLFSKTYKFRPVDIQNATLAGGVAIGCTANLTLSPFGAIMIGCTAGIVSTFGYNFIQPFLENTIKLHDTCGIHNLHALPSVVGGLASVVLAAYKNYHGKTHDINVYGDYHHTQWWRQLLAIPFCVGFAIFAGLIVGYVLKLINPKADNSDNNSTGIKEFHDSEWWTVAGDYNKTIYSELGLLLTDSDLNEVNDSQAVRNTNIVSQAIIDFSSHNGRRIPPNQAVTKSDFSNNGKKFEVEASKV